MFSSGWHESLPAFLIGLIILVYWVRVLQMVRRTKRTVGRAANFLPPERLGRWLRAIWIPVVALWVLLPLVIGAFRPDVFLLRPLYSLSLVAWCAFAVAVIAFAATWICWRNMGRSWRMGIDPKEKTELVFSGPFAYVRNPIYGLSSLLMVATVAAAPAPLMIVVGVLHLAMLQWEVRREERYLLALHGEAYDDYKAHVGRFLPRSLAAYRRTGAGSAAQ